MRRSPYSRAYLAGRSCRDMPPGNRHRYEWRTTVWPYVRACADCGKRAANQSGAPTL